MSRSLKRYVGKIEALDFAAGTYNTRTIKREKFNQHDFLEYLNALEMLENSQTYDFQEEEVLE
jgi:hypothetical protein